MQKENQQKFRSGDVVPMSCRYKAYDKNGESRDEDTTYLEKGNRFPPTQHEGAYWKMDMEKNASRTDKMGKNK